MSNIATTISQSRKLIELGLEPGTADMVWMFNKWLYSIKDNILHREQFSEQDTLAWSLSALLELIPKNMIPILEWRDGKNEWEVNVWVDHDHNIHSISHYDKLIAAYGMVCWLLEQGLIEKGDNDETK